MTFIAGLKPVFGPVSFDLGVIYYTYPHANDSGAELNFFEVKAGASVSPWKDGTIGGTVFYSPEYTGEIGDVWTFERGFHVGPQAHRSLGHGSDEGALALSGDDQPFIPQDAQRALHGFPGDAVPLRKIVL